MFETSVPKDVEVISQFPKELIGTYSDGKTDTLTITEKTFKYGKSKKSFLIAGSLDKEESELRKLNDFYYLNLRDEGDEYWTVFPFQLSDDGLDAYYIIMETLIERLDTTKSTKEREMEVIESMNKITKVKVIEKPDSDDKNYLINPTNQELEELMQQGFFVKLGGFKRLK
jgi:hypothetical protein